MTDIYSEYTGLLTKTALFKNISNDDLNAMLTCLKPKLISYKKNDLIAVAGNPFDSMGIMLSGEATIIKENAAGNRIVMDMLKPADLFGEMVVFAGKAIWPVSIVAQTPCLVMFLPKQKIAGQCEQLCSWHHDMIENLLKLMSEKTIHLNKKIEYLSLKSMRGKISSFLIDQYKKTGQTTFMLPLMRNELADFLNVSRPSMSREMSRMRDEGVIDFHRSSIQIKDLHALKQMTNE